MLVDLYVEALLVDEELADRVWVLWNARLISDDLAACAWLIVANDAMSALTNSGHSESLELVGTDGS